MKKISATILDFARPLTDGLGDDTPIEIRRETLQLAITLWNCLVLRDCGQGEHLADLFDRLRGLSVTDTMRMAPLIEELVLRKHTKYRRDQRLVGDWELRDLGGGELSLRAVAHDPRRPRGS